MGLLGRAHGGGPRRVRAASSTPQPDDVAVTTSLSAGVSALASAIDFSERPKVVISDYEFPTIGQIWHAQQLRGARSHVVARPEIRRGSTRRSTSAPRSSRSRRSATGTARGSPVEEIAQHRARARRAVLLDAYQAAGSYPLDVRSSASTSSPPASSSTCSAPPGSASCGPGRARRPSCRRRRPAGSPTATSSRWTHALRAVADRAALPVGHAAGAGDLRGHRRDRADAGDRHRRDARARERAQRAADRRRRRARRHGRHAARRRAARRARLHRARPTLPALVAALGEDGIVTSERDGNLRVSAHAYNTVEDIDAVLAALERHRACSLSDCVDSAQADPVATCIRPMTFYKTP